MRFDHCKNYHSILKVSQQKMISEGKHIPDEARALDDEKSEPDEVDATTEDVSKD